MVRLIRRRSIIIPMSGVILVVLLAVAVGAAIRAGWMAPRSGPAPLATPGAMATGAPGAAGVPAVQLVDQDLTPSSRLGVTAAGFLGKEHLDVTILDAQGTSYAQTTLVAGDDGRLRQTSLAPPPQLASGEYRLVVTGSESHRRASVAFRMHDIPPSVALDAYSAKPGQDVRFTGAGFFSGEEVHAYLGQSTAGQSPAPLASVRATDVGAVAGQVGIPALPPGAYTLTLVGAHSRTPASVGFSVLGFSAWVVLNRYAVKAGEGVGCIGQGFGPNEQVFIYLNALKGDPALRVTTDPSGRFVVQDSWAPSGASGDNTLTFVGQSSKATATATFMVLPGAQPTAEPPAAPATP